MEATVYINGIPTTRLTFPRFLDMDYYFFHELELAKKNGQGMIVAKARRKGFSYKNAAICAYMYNFHRDSTSIIGAFLKEYSDNTMRMALEMVNFVNKHTAWRKRKDPDKKDYIQARFKETIDGNSVWSGYNSRIFTLTFKDNFSAAIGKKAALFLFEEAGKWPNLIDSYMITAPTFRDGNVMIGIPIIFGTGGDMEGGTQDFAEMFYDPDKFFLRPYENIWDDGALGTQCGYFVDDMWYKPGEVLMPNGTVYNGVNEDGVSNREVAEFSIDKEREDIKKAKSRRTYEKHISQYCKTPREAFLRSSGNIFPAAELTKWLGRLETDNKAKNLGIPGELYWDEEKVKFSPNLDLYPIEKYPLKPDDEMEGAVVIWETPFKDNENNTPYGMYIAGTDPYDHDESTTNSLGSTFIYKTFQSFDKTYNMVVAEYTGRPPSAKEYYETVRKLLTYYNAKTLYENNLKGLKVYFEQKKCLSLLKEQPSILKDIVPNSKVHRGYGTHMSDSIKIQAEIYLRDWLLEKVADGADGEDILNLHKLYSIPLVQELIAYNKEGNFDRVIALMLVMLHSQENHKVSVEKEYQGTFQDKFWTKKLFKRSPNSSF
jgi:hypothetical protein